MSPNEVHDLLHTPFPTDEKLQNIEKIRKEIPEGAIALWIMKPTKSNIEEARWGTYTRSTLIVFSLLYLIIFENFNSTAIWALMVMVGYECAYTALRKEKNEIDNILAAERYRKKVNKLLRKTYPEYKPPQR